MQGAIISRTAAVSNQDWGCQHFLLSGWKLIQVPMSGSSLQQRLLPDAWVTLLPRSPHTAVVEPLLWITICHLPVISLSISSTVCTVAWRSHCWSEKAKVIGRNMIMHNPGFIYQVRNTALFKKKKKKSTVCKQPVFSLLLIYAGWQFSVSVNTSPKL